MGGSDEKTTATSGGRDRGCESSPQICEMQWVDAGRLLLDPGLTLGFEAFEEQFVCCWG
jgi:hypothetical protein